MWNPLQGKKNGIGELVIPFENTHIFLPYVEIVGEKEGPIVLVTAGMDGDEYAGIEAAYKLIEEYQKKLFSGVLRIVPIVNIPGFEAGVSWNPIDKKFPKHIFPGTSRGTHSEQLIFHLWETLGKNISLWIDLHGGARNEKLEPHVIGFFSQNEAIDTQTKEYLRALHYKTTVMSSWDKGKRVSQKNCVYLFFEAGDRGIVEQSAVVLHMQWVKKILSKIEEKQKEKNILKYYRTVYYHVSHSDGFFIPKHIDAEVKKGTIIGAVFSKQRKKLYDVRLRSDGCVLYHRLYGWVKKGEDLITIASDVTVE